MSVELPVGSIVAWAKSFTGVPSQLTDGWVECNGQVLSDLSSGLNGATIPNLNGAAAGTHRFLRGSTTSGSVCGADCVTVCITVCGTTQTTSNNVGAGSGSAVCVSCSIHCHQFNGTGSTSVSVLPSYYEVVYIMKIK